MSMLLALLLACTSGKDPSGDDGLDDPDGGLDSGDTGVAADECDDAAGRILCLDGEAVECDAAGDVASRETCADADVCQEDAGCISCALTLDTLRGADATADALVRLPDAGDAELPWAVRAAGMRPITVAGADPLLATGTVTVSLGDGDAGAATLWSEDGEALSLPLSFDAAELPRTLLLEGAIDGGTFSLTARTDDCAAEPVSLSLRVAPWRPLAGRSLGGFPWLETVDAFTFTEQPQVGVDPLLHGDLAGAEVDLYVVAHRDAAAWAEDPTLVDGGDGAETLVLDGVDLADQITTAWATDLDVDEGVLAEAWDVVLDVDRDGALSPGDVFEGVGAQAPAFWALGDLTARGPWTPSVDQYREAIWLGQRLYWPAEIAGIAAESGPLPLVVISHGNGHDYRWYDYLGEHLASWGFVVMAHENETGPGILTASTTTLANTDWLLTHLAEVADGELVDRLDTARIAWIGHSRGGEGVAMAYDRLVEGAYVPEAYDADDIVFISSIAPTVFYPVTESDPHDRWYHLIAGGADGDVTGGPTSGVVQYLRIAEAARADVAVTYVQGASHNDFNCCGFDDGTGPDLIGRSRAQDLSKSTYLALLSWVVQGDPAPAALVRRSYESFHDAAVDDSVIVANQWRPDPAGALVLDDFQTGETLELASSGGAVTVAASEAVEGRADDGDYSFAWVPRDPYNSLTLAEDGDDEARVLILAWEEDTEASWRLDLPDGATDWTGATWLSLRAAQTSRHPLVAAHDGPAVFSVVVEDADGNRSALALDDLGLSLTEPYARTGYGVGEGWAAEWNTLRLRVSDFAAAGRALDLSRVAAVELRFGVADDGTAWGDAFGRVALDDLMLVED